jgi:hypothetical protein
MSLLRRLRAMFVTTEKIRTQHVGDVVVLKTWTNQLMGCCDCGLMHRYDFKVSPEGFLLVSARRDDVATLAIRRDRSFAFTQR